MSSGSLAEHHDSTTEAEQAEPRLWNRSLVWLPLFTGLVGLALLFVASELTDRKSLPGGLWWIAEALALVAVASSASLSLTRAYQDLALPRRPG